MCSKDTEPRVFQRGVDGARIAALALPCVILQTLCLLARPRFSEKSGKRTIDLWSHRWWEMVPDTHPPRIHGPMYGEEWSQLLPNIDTYPPIYQPGRSVTIDIDGRCRFTYGELRSIFDRRLKVDIILWSISSTIPVKNWSKERPPHFLCLGFKHLVHILRGESSSSGFLIREHGK